jgi:hypothetical protein
MTPNHAENGPRLLQSATHGGQCVRYGGRGTGSLAFGRYPLGSKSVISIELAMLGPYADGSTSTEDVVFVAYMGGNRSELAPLEKFGFVLLSAVT